MNRQPPFDGRPRIRPCRGIRAVCIVVVIALIFFGVAACDPPEAAVEAEGAGDATPSASSGGGDITQPEIPRDRAILRLGPVRRRGIDFLGPNVIDHQLAEYRVTEGIITVIYFEYPGRLWEVERSYRCGSKTVSVVETYDGPVHLYTGAGWKLFLVFPETFDPPCLFLSQFLPDLQFFRDATEGDPALPFPATVALDR